MDVKERGADGTPEGPGKATKARRKPTVKAPGDPGDRRSLNLRIDGDTYERLHIHALRRRQTISDLVMELARLNLREFHITRTPGGASRGEETAGVGAGG